MSYPLFQDKMKKRIRRIMICNDEIYCSVDGNNEVSTWDCESATRTKTLWASPAPCLSSRHSSHHSVLSLIVDSSRDTNSVITAGDDMKIRFWDLINPHRSYIVNGSPLSTCNKLSPASTTGSKPLGVQTMADSTFSPISSVQYQMKLVDGIQVVQETDRLPSLQSNRRQANSKNKVTSSSDTGSSSKSGLSENFPGQQQKEIEFSQGVPITSCNSVNQSSNINDNCALSTAHHDSISCLASVSQSSLLLSSSRDGVIKIWR